MNIVELRLLIAKELLTGTLQEVLRDQLLNLGYVSELIDHELSQAAKSPYLEGAKIAIKARGNTYSAKIDPVDKEIKNGEK